MKTLRLTLKRKWFDMIASGEKKEEYREIKRYWIQRLCDEIEYENNYLTSFEGVYKKFDTVSANNGYAKDCPNIQWKHKGIRIGKPNPKWCEPEDVDKTVFILEIGELIKINSNGQVFN